MEPTTLAAAIALCIAINQQTAVAQDLLGTKGVYNLALEHRQGRLQREFHFIVKNDRSARIALGQDAFSAALALTGEELLAEEQGCYVEFSYLFE